MENTIPDPNERLIPFLRNLADSIEQKQLVPRQLAAVGEFFMSYQFQDEKSRDDEGISVPFGGDNGDFDSKELMKFLILGWWIYSHILKEERTIPRYE